MQPLCGEIGLSESEGGILKGSCPDPNELCRMIVVKVVLELVCMILQVCIMQLVKLT